MLEQNEHLAALLAVGQADLCSLGRRECQDRLERRGSSQTGTSSSSSDNEVPRLTHFASARTCGSGRACLGSQPRAERQGLALGYRIPAVRLAIKVTK